MSDLEKDKKNTNTMSDVQTIAWFAFLMCVLGAVFYAYEYYLRVAPSVMREELLNAYQLSNAGLGILVAYYYYSYVPLQLPVGLMMDRLGPRRILTAACFTCALGTYLFAGSNIIWVAKIGRFLVGFGSAFAYVGVLKIANLWLPRRYFAMMAGLCTALGMLGAMSGEIVMASFVEIAGWKKTLYASAFVGFILTIILWLFIRDRSSEEVAKFGRKSFEQQTLWQQVVATVKTKLLFFNGLIGCLMFLPLTIFAEMWAVPYLQEAGLSRERAALGSSLVFLGYALGSPAWGIFSDSICSRRIPLMLGSIIATVFAAIIIWLPPQTEWLLFACLLLLGISASSQPLVFAVGNDVCKPELSATTVSYTNLLIMLGGALFQPLIGFFMDYFHISATEALAILPIGLAISFIISIFLQESYNSHLS